MTETVITETVRNGVDTATHVRDARRHQGPARDRPVPVPRAQPWLGGAHNRSTIKDFYAACGEDTSRTEAFDARRRRARHPAGQRRGPEPGRVPAARAGRLRDHLARLLGGRPRVRLTMVESTLEGDLNVEGRDGHQHRRLPQRLRADPDEHPHRGRRARREAARGRAARHRPLGRLRLDHEGVPVSVDVDTV